MERKFTDALAEWVKKKEDTKPKKGRVDKHLVAFLALKEDVSAAINEGYSLKTIWGYLNEKGSVTCRYESFTKHVKKYISGSKETPKKNETLNHAEAVNTDLKKEKSAGFTFNPKPNKEDLF